MGGSWLGSISQVPMVKKSRKKLETRSRLCNAMSQVTTNLQRHSLRLSTSSGVLMRSAVMQVLSTKAPSIYINTAGRESKLQD